MAKHSRVEPVNPSSRRLAWIVMIFLLVGFLAIAVFAALSGSGAS